MDKLSRFILSAVICLFAINFMCTATMAKDEEVTIVSAAASSTYFDSTHYGPHKAIDGNENSFWVGERDSVPWWIKFDMGKTTKIDYLSIKWYQFLYYIPLDYDIQISDDDTNWENLYTGIAGSTSANGEIREINRETRYIRFYIRSVKYYFPILREVMAYHEVNVPALIRFQGKLKDAESNPIDGALALTLRIYDTDTDGVPLWEEVQEGVYIEDGLLDVELGSVTPLDLPFDKQYWLGVEVEYDGEMLPRFKLTTVPYAFRSNN